MEKKCDRRKFLKRALKTAAVGGAAAMTGCSTESIPGSKEEAALKWEEFFKGNYRLMTEEEKLETVARLERLAKLRHNLDITVSSKDANEQVLFGYAFNISRISSHLPL